MTYRIVHWGTGATGGLALGAVLDRADFELVGQYVWNPEKAGFDAGELIGRAPVGIKATQDIEALIALQPGGMTVVESFCSTMAGPAKTLPTGSR